MKNLWSAFALFAILFAACSTNPVETEAYKKLNSGLEELKTNYTDLSTSIMSLGAVGEEMKAAVENMESPTDELKAYAAQYNATFAEAKAKLASHTEMITAHADKMNNHSKMKMADCMADFDAMTADYGTMMEEGNAMKNNMMKIQAAYQNAFNMQATMPN